MSLDKHFDQMEFVPSKLISLIGLISENNSSSRNASQNTLAITGLIVYNYKKGTHKRKSTVIPPKLRWMIFTLSAKGSLDKISKSNEATKYFLGTSMRAFRSIKPVDNGIERRYSHNDLVGTVGDCPTPVLHKRSTTIKEIQRIFLCITHY